MPQRLFADQPQQLSHQDTRQTLMQGLVRQSLQRHQGLGLSGSAIQAQRCRSHRVFGGAEPGKAMVKARKSPSEVAPAAADKTAQRLDQLMLIEHDDAPSFSRALGFIRSIKSAKPLPVLLILLL